MTIKESLYFSFDGVSSETFGITNVQVGSGLYEEPLLPTRQINEQKIRGNDIPYHQDVEAQPLEFDITFAFEDGWDSDKIRSVCRWLYKDYYKELYFSEDSERIFYVIFTTDPKIFHNGLKQGYGQIRARCNSPYSYSPIYTSPLYDYSANVAEGTLLQFNNQGDLPLKPELEITKVGAGDVRIVNESNGNAEFEITGLQDGEVVYFDNQNEYMETSVAGEYRINNFNDGWLELIYGVNNLRVYGNCKLQFRYQYIRLQ